MTIELKSTAELLNKLTSSKQQIVILAGSALAWDSGGGVPGVAGVVALARETVQTSGIPPSEFDRALHGKGGAEAYQTAMNWLRDNISQDCVNEVIRAAVLQARAVGSPSDFCDDGEAVDWYLPKAVVHLSSLVVGAPKKFGGLLLTTNFDPLLSVGISKAGRTAVPVALDTDGGFTSVLTGSTATKIVHLHGYWRDSDTLHTSTQLTATRPKLRTDIQSELMGKTLLVVGYAGWDDIATKALAELCLQPRLERTEILWCFYERDTHVVNAQYAKLLESMAPLHSKGRFFAYGGIDCHQVFADIGTRLEVKPVISANATRIPFGWSVLSTSDLATFKTLSTADLLRYYDGAAPNLRHACTDYGYIPKRDATGELLKVLAALGTHPFIVRVSGGAGEGKTTVLLQTAVEAVKTGAWKLLLRTNSDASLSTADILALDPNSKWLIFADDAEDLVPQLKVIELALEANARSNIGFVVACRRTDWLAAHGESGWTGFVDRSKSVLLSGLSSADAQLIVDAWARVGPEALATLSLLEPAQRAVRLKNAVRDELGKSGDGALIGGLLAVRYTDQRLRLHVRSLLEHLRDARIPGATHSLFDVLVVVACVHSVGIRGIYENVLAELIGLGPAAIAPLVLEPLAEEAAGRSYAHHVLTRHRRLAIAIVEEADETFGVDIGDVWASLIAVTAQLGRSHLAGATHADILHVGPLLIDQLPQTWPPQRRVGVAVEVARAAVTALPEVLVCLTTHGRTLRKAGKYGDACTLFRHSFQTASETLDYRKAIRSYFHEWAVCEGLADRTAAGKRRNLWLDLISLSDLHESIPITDDNLLMCCAGVAESALAVATFRPDITLLRLCQAATWIGRQSPSLDAKSVQLFDKFEAECAKQNAPACTAAAKALEWWFQGLTSFTPATGDEFSSGLHSPRDLQFVELTKSIRSAPQRKVH